MRADPPTPTFSAFEDIGSGDEGLLSTAYLSPSPVSSVFPSLHDSSYWNLGADRALSPSSNTLKRRKVGQAVGGVSEHSIPTGLSDLRKELDHQRRLIERQSREMEIQRRGMETQRLEMEIQRREMQCLQQEVECQRRGMKHLLHQMQLLRQERGHE